MKQGLPKSLEHAPGHSCRARTSPAGCDATQGMKLVKLQTPTQRTEVTTKKSYVEMGNHQPLHSPPKLLLARSQNEDRQAVLISIPFSAPFWCRILLGVCFKIWQGPAQILRASSPNPGRKMWTGFRPPECDLLIVVVKETRTAWRSQFWVHLLKFLGSAAAHISGRRLRGHCGTWQS